MHHQCPITVAFLYLLCLAASQNTSNSQEQGALQYRFACLDQSSIPPSGTYQNNLNNLITFLSSDAVTSNGFCKGTSGTNQSNNRVYGLYFCGGDYNTSLCHSCVQNSGRLIKQLSPNNASAALWYTFCLLRYSNQNFFGKLTITPRIPMFDAAHNSTSAGEFDSDARVLMNGLIQTAAETTLMFGTHMFNINGTQRRYGWVQCSRDITSEECRTCLSNMLEDVENCCEEKKVWCIFPPSCIVKCEIEPFFLDNTLPEAPAPQPGAQLPLFMGNDCHNSTEQHLTKAHQTNLYNVLRLLSSDAATSKRCNYTSAGTGTGDAVYGLYVCRGDVVGRYCQFCVSTASRDTLTRCPNRLSAVAWYGYCMVRYSNQNFIGSPTISPALHRVGSKNISGPSELGKAETFMRNLIRKATVETNQLFALGGFDLSPNKKRYGLVQCTRDLNNEKCSECLKAMLYEVPQCCGTKREWRVWTPSCLLIYGDYMFYELNTQTTSSPSMPDPRTAKQGDTSRSRTLIISIASALVAVALFSFSIYYFLSRNRATKETLLFKTTPISFHCNVQSENSYEDLPTFPFITIRESTNNFSEGSKLGEGGFGPVYKGILPDGREIAVKRLSKTSGQGLEEFKNEVIFIAKLQHVNLVRLLGCCIHKEEKLLLYEYMPNSSLDSYLFDVQKQRQLDWKLRLSIINGITRGILYLHEDSRLKVIHRDLKVSNILLDCEINPKISDFGLAKTFERGQNQANTNRVMGTYGYMAPEYAMQGLFSVKSDVFSFGVLMLEIICGQRNGFYLSKHDQSLLVYTWKLWCEGKSLELIDPSIEKSYIANEVTRCIHIGLLCVQEDAADRPTMSSVVVMLASDTMTLPIPNQPAFSVGRMVLGEGSTSKDSKNPSINEVTMSHISPR